MNEREKAFAGDRTFQVVIVMERYDFADLNGRSVRFNKLTRVTVPLTTACAFLTHGEACRVKSKQSRPALCQLRCA